MTDFTQALGASSDDSRASRAGKRMIQVAICLKAFESLLILAVMFVVCTVETYAQTQPSGSLFGGNAINLSNSTRSVVYVIRNLTFIGGIIAVCWGAANIWMGQRFVRQMVGGGISFGIATVLAVIYEFSQGNNVQVDADF